MFNKILSGALLICGSQAIKILSDPICNSYECTQYLHPKVKDSHEWPISYEVPNFGMDRDI